MSSEAMLRILLVDDQATIHEDYRKILGRQPGDTATAISKAAAALFGDDPDSPVEWEGFDLDSAYQGQDGVALVQQSVEEGRPYAMAFVDIRMPPGWNGIETVRHIWEVDPEILIVICSAYSDYSWDEMVKRLGRSDRYLILKKPFDNIEVRQCAMALTERWKISRTDVLTGLLNRRAFRSHLDLEWGRATRHGLPLACAMLDLDDFKCVNDTLGHLAGDSALAAAAHALKANCRATDLVCRYGGDEFCVLLPHTGQEQAATWAEHARQAIAATSVTVADRSIAIAASFGVAHRLDGDDGAHRLVERADRALMCAKNTGRNHVVLFSHASEPPGSLMRGDPTAAAIVAAAPAVVSSAGGPGQLVQYVQFPSTCAPVEEIAMATNAAGLTDTIIGAAPTWQPSLSAFASRS
jgi:diguanylate cyclase (GGDEF)-like protein